MNGFRISALVGTLLVLLLSFSSPAAAAPEGQAVTDVVVSDNPCC